MNDKKKHAKNSKEHEIVTLFSDKEKSNKVIKLPHTDNIFFFFFKYAINVLF